MKLLLDTHVLLWVAVQQSLSPSATAAFLDPNNELYLSAASYWELCIKQSIGKLALMPNWVVVLDQVMLVNHIQWLPLTKAHCQKLVTLPLLHGDPFDRIMIAQALCENLTLLTADANIRQYTVSTLW
ncbi:MAG: type II toxin-antitoxin system VapC family toxin [Caldilineaceae bacterium]